MHRSDSGLFKPSDVKANTTSPDLRAAYQHNQERWHSFSASVKAELLEQLPLFSKDVEDCDFSDEFHQLYKTELMWAYSFLAKKRQQIAVELQQGANDTTNRTKFYGTFRDENYLSFEKVLATNDPNWPHQKDAILKHVKELLDATKNSQPAPPLMFRRHNSPAPTAEEIAERLKKRCIYRFENYSVEKELTEAQPCADDSSSNLPVTRYTLTFKSPNKGNTVDGAAHSSNTVKIIYYDFPDNSALNYMTLQYATMNEHNMVGDCLLAERYYQACRKATDREEFFMNAGRLAHLLAQVLWVKLGNAAITEWLIETLEQEKGISVTVPPFNDGLSWDWKALVTPNREAYARWFMNSVYQLNNEPDVNSKNQLK